MTDLTEAIERSIIAAARGNLYPVDTAFDVLVAITAYMTANGANVLRLVDGELRLGRTLPVSTVTCARDGEQWDEMRVQDGNSLMGRPLFPEERPVTLTDVEAPT